MSGVSIWEGFVSALASTFNGAEAVDFVILGSFALRAVGLADRLDGSSRVVGRVVGERAGTCRTFEELIEG